MRKLFFMAALAAMTLVSCNKDNENIGPGGIPDGESTYASFAFNSAKTRAIADFNPLGVLADDAGDEVIDAAGQDLYIIVFNAGGVMESFTEVVNNPQTVLVTAGSGKRIFVLANMANIESSLVATTGAPTLNTAASSINIAAIQAGITYADFMAIAFNAGTPQAFDVTKNTTGRTFSVLPLSTQVGGTYSLGLPMSNSNRYTFDFAPNVTETQAESATTPSTSGSNPDNRFSIALDYLSAKARLYVNLAGMPQTIADITNPAYTIKNLAKFTSLSQNVVGGAPRSIYHSHVWGVGSQNQATFQPHIDQASNVLLDPEVALANSPFIFVPENTHANLLRGQSSFYALNVTYEPNTIIETVGFNPLSSVSTYTTDAYGNIYSGTGNTYVYVTDATVLGDITTPFFASVELLAKAYWQNQNNVEATVTNGYVEAAVVSTLTTNEAYKTYLDAQSWYRIDMGIGNTAASTVYGVLRGNAYTATIDNITGPGEPSEEDLFDNPDDPVVARTYINVTIKAAEWYPVTQNGIILH